MKEIKLSIDDELYNRMEKFCEMRDLDMNNLIDAFIHDGFEEFETVTNRTREKLIAEMKNHT